MDPLLSDFLIILYTGWRHNILGILLVGLYMHTFNLGFSIVRPKPKNFNDYTK